MSESKVEKMQLNNEIKSANTKNRYNDKRDGKSIKTNMNDRNKLK
jgi:hypothetical protein